MDQTNSFSEFFYNLVPGGLLLLGLNFIYPEISKPIKSDNGFTLSDALVIFYVIIISLSVGFFFQGLTKITEAIPKLKGWREKFVFSKLAQGESKDLYEGAFAKLTERVNDNLKIDDHRRNFYLMDNTIRSTANFYIIHHFSTKAAFWFNIFWASVILAICISIRKFNTDGFDGFFPLLPWVGDNLLLSF